MKTIDDYYFYSDFYFEEHIVGNIARLFTDKINDIGVLLDDSDLLSSKKGYNVHIISMSETMFKFTWNLKLINKNNSLQYYEPNMKQIKKICEYFCVNDWEKEFHYHSFYNDHDHFSSEKYDIHYYTKPWVDYITFQNSRIILQFDFEKFKKGDFRKYKLQQIT